MFELRRLRLLHELAQRGTLAAVAEALSYSPSTVSQQLAQLERDAGVPLLVPDGRRVRLTAHGSALAAHAARALAMEEEIRGELESLRTQSAPVRIAVLQTVAQSLLPDALTLLARTAPALRIDAAEVPPELGLFELTAHGYDLVIAEQYPGHARERRAPLTREILGEDPIRVAVPPDSAASSLRDLADMPWVMEHRGTAARQWAVQQCRAAGFEPDVRFELADLTAHARLIASGHAAGLLPDLLWTDHAPTVRLIDLPGAPVREIFAAMRSSSAGRAGILAVREALRESFTQRVAMSPSRTSADSAPH